MITDEEWARQIQQESGGRQSAVSPKGATGVAQVMRGTGPEAAALAGLPWDENLWKNDAAYNERIGRAYMDKQLEDFGDYRMALAAYNWGPPRMKRLIAAKGDDWERFLPRETKEYIANITGAPMSDGKDELGADSLLRTMKGGGRTTSPYPQAGQLQGMEALLNDTASIGGGRVAPTPEKPLGGPVSSAPEPSTPEAPERSTLQKAGRLAATIGGGMAGAAAGTLVGGPAGTIAGAGLGSAAGSYLAETFDPSDNAHREALIEGLTGAAGQGVAMGIGKLLFPSVVREGGDDLLKVLANKTMPTPGQYFDSRGLTVLENVGMSAFFGNKSLAQASANALSGARHAAVTWQAQVAANKALGEEAFNQVAMAAKAGGAFADVGKAARVAQALTQHFPGDSAVKRVANTLLQAPQGRMPFTLGIDDVTANAMWQGTPIRPMNVGIKELRSQLLALSRDTAIDSNERTVAKQLAKLVDESAQEALKKADPRLLGEWRAANKFYQEGIQGEEIGTMFSKALISGGQKGEIGGKQLLNALKEHRLDALDTPLTPSQIENITKYAKAISAAEGSGSKAFTLISNGFQVNAVVRLATAVGGGAGAAAATGNDPIAGAGLGAGVVLLGPAAIAKMLASPKVFKLMLAASRMPAGSEQAGVLGTQLVSQMLREGILTADQRPDQPTGEQAAPYGP